MINCLCDIYPYMFLSVLQAVVLVEGVAAIVVEGVAVIVVEEEVITVVM